MWKCEPKEAQFAIGDSKSAMFVRPEGFEPPTLSSVG